MGPQDNPWDNTSQWKLTSLPSPQKLGEIINTVLKPQSLGAICYTTIDSLQIHHYQKKKKCIGHLSCARCVHMTPCIYTWSLFMLFLQWHSWTHRKVWKTELSFRLNNQAHLEKQVLPASLFSSFHKNFVTPQQRVPLPLVSLESDGCCATIRLCPVCCLLSETKPEARFQTSKETNSRKKAVT